MRPIIQKMVLILLAIALLPVFLVGTVFYLNSETTLQQQVLNQLEAIATTQQARTESLIMQNHEILESFTTRRPFLVRLDRYNRLHSKDDLAVIQQSITDTRAGLRSLKAITVLNPAGEVVASTRTEDIGENYAHEPYFKQGQAANDVTSNIFRDENGSPVAHLVGPMRLEGKLAGVAVIESDANSLLASTRDYTGLGETGETILVKRDDQGNLVFLAPLRHKGTSLQQAASAVDKHNPVTRALAGEESDFADATDYRGHKVLAATRYIEPAGWGLVTKIDQAEAFQPLTQLRDFLVVTVFILSVLIVFVAFYLARRLNEPILALAAVADKIRSGDLSRRAQITTKDEIGQLARTFNAMADNIQKIDQMKSEFVLLTSHQLRTPATAVKGFISMLLDGYSGKVNPEHRELLEAAYTENERQISVINSILDVARMESGQMALVRGMHDVGRVIEASAAGQAPMLQSLDQRLAIIRPKEPVNLWVDDEKLQLVIDNLIHNATKYSPPGTKITVELKREGQRVLIRVEDQGYGIAHKDMPRLFKRFSRIAGPHTANIQGAGLGLYLAEKLVRMHGGKIQVHSIVGKGTTFTVVLPNITKEPAK